MLKTGSFRFVSFVVIDGVILNSLFKTMITQKCLPGFFYIKRKEGERERDSGETERKCVCEAECCGKKKIASAIKLTVRERKKTCDGNVRLISKIKNDNDVTPAIHIRSSVHL